MRFEVLKPEPVQLVAFDDDQLKEVYCPCVSDVGDAENEAVGAGGGAVTVSVLLLVDEETAF